jgi:threonine dehydratase
MVPAMFEEIVAASARFDVQLRPEVAETPLRPYPSLDHGETTVLAKLENRQPTGSFKLRGATAKVATLTAEQRRAGVVTASTGNHGAAVARAAGNAGVTVEVFVSPDADPEKVAAIRARGATITTIPGDPIVAEVAAREVAARSGRTYLPPYNDVTVVAGQGTIGVELLRQAPDLAAVVVSVGGGGLISGIAATLKAHRPQIRVIGASAVNTAAMHHSVAAGRIVELEHHPTLSDGTAGGIEPGAVTFEMCRLLVDEWLLINEDEIAAAMRSYISNYDEPIEGSAAMALAACARIDVAGPVAAVVCGGNVSAGRLESIGISS